MIVKNEKDVIKRCLASVQKIVDYWVIVDTGSTDGTQEIIRDFMRDIPGELHERSWVNFEHNRNAALELARNHSDYVFFIDADEVLVCTQPLDKSQLKCAFYAICSKGKDSEHTRIHLINNDKGWKWVGVLHEAIIHSHDQNGEFLNNLYIDFSALDGYRFRDPKKFIHDAEILEKALQENPRNARYVFYLAQSYMNAREYLPALKNFMKRAMMLGEPDETYFAQFCVGYVQQELKMDYETIMDSYLKAYALNATRAEPIERLSYLFCQKNWGILAYVLAKFGLQMPNSLDFNSHRLHWVYDYSLMLLLADASLLVGRQQEAFAAYQKVLQCSSLPQNLRLYVQRRLIKIRISSNASSSFST